MCQISPGCPVWKAQKVTVHKRDFSCGLLTACAMQQAFVGVCGWISPQALLGVLAWTAALMLLDAVRGGRLQVAWLHMQPAQDIETGRLEITRGQPVS